MSMKVDCALFEGKFNKVAVATSGGPDSMALLHFLNANKDLLKIHLLAINVEHGIRGKDSISDSQFVKDYCTNNSIPLLSYSVDSISYAKDNKLSLEESARALRYQCFNDAKAQGLFDYLLTAHHALDNVETVLFNLFRGSGLSGLSGIPKEKDYIVRPLINVGKDEIEAYVMANNVPYVADQTNFCDDYTRNFIRLNVIPKIKEIFPKAEQSVSRLVDTVKKENDFLDQLATNSLKVFSDRIEIALDTPEVVLRRAVIKALKLLGVKKDWEKIHVEDAVSLTKKQNGDRISLPLSITLYREYDKLVFEKDKQIDKKEINFSLGCFTLGEKKVIIEKVDSNVDLKDGNFYLDLDKIPDGTVIRYARNNDVFTKFGGGTKSLGDYFTDKKVALRIRDRLPIIAKDNQVFAIFSIAISDKAKIDQSTKTIIKITYED